MAETLRRLGRMVAVLAVATAGSAATVSVADAAPPAGSTDTQPYVVGGEDTTTQKHPWVVALTTPSGFQFCGGTLVAPNKVVTAAHCTDGDHPSQVRVVAGRTDLRTSQGTVAGVRSIWVHPDYRRVTAGNDVSVLTLDRSLHHRTLPLASATDAGLYAPGSPATILGWGRTSEGGSASPVLKQATVPVVSDSDCFRAYGGRYSQDAMVCAGYQRGGVDTCQGDSGGPMVVGDKLIGVTSWGDGCARAGKPGVYARVASYHDVLTRQISS
ncbi:serine protease [Longimycelium tulufanense]|uniref:Serine protease n=1 Tax=Longimycelium tulufanense TaxID=907463 RepID=A0A8J3FSJ0_9PSEU|nr:serine protease [Longimycelium tulufanense]GGM39001.1 serine protease [Longimycelium tulufanense]